MNNGAAELVEAQCVIKCLVALLERSVLAFGAGRAFRMSGR
jgi:hypothetical protein